MNLCKKISALFFLIFPANLSAQNVNCQITKKFPVKKGTALRITNKYGDIRVITGNEDLSLSVQLSQSCRMTKTLSGRA